MKILLLSILISQISFANTEPEFCLGDLMVTLETGERMQFCEESNRLVSRECVGTKDKCELLLDLDKKLITLDQNHISKSGTFKNPGSEVCSLLGWTVLMAQMHDQSQVCVCVHPNNSKVICTSLLQD